jgi:hypothetical protein
MVECGNRARLPFEALAHVRPFRDVRRKHLDGNGAVQPRIARFVDFAHAAAPIGKRIS